MPVTVRIYMNQYHSSPRPLIAGMVTEFGCRTEGSKPNANIEWFLGDQRIVMDNNVKNNDHTLVYYNQLKYCHHILAHNYSIANNNCIGESSHNEIMGSANANSTIHYSSKTQTNNDLHNIDFSIQINRLNRTDKAENSKNGLKDTGNWLLSCQCKFLSIMETNQVNSTLSIIRFIPHFTDNNRMLFCHASNPFIGNQFNKITDKISLNVQCMSNYFC